MLLVIIVLVKASAFFIPVTIALLASVLLAPVVRALGRLGLPRAVSAVLILLVLTSTVFWAAQRLSGPAMDWMRRLPTDLAQVKGKLHALVLHVQSGQQRGRAGGPARPHR